MVPDICSKTGLAVGGTKCAASEGTGVTEPDWHPESINNRMLVEMFLTIICQYLFNRGFWFIGFCFVVKFRFVQY